MKTGLFGGTFNPVHNGHIQTIQHVIQSHSLDRVFFIPSAQPPHKPDTALASARDRFDMVKASITGLNHLLVSDLELNRKGPSYTIDTIKHFSRQAKKNETLFLIAGTDAFFDMGSWKDFKQIFKQIHIIVMQRATFQNDPETFNRFLETTISHGYTYNEPGQSFHHPALKCIYICNTPEIAISSTDIRFRIRNGLPVKALVPMACNEMIINKGLYL